MILMIEAFAWLTGLLAITCTLFAVLGICERVLWLFTRN